VFKRYFRCGNFFYPAAFPMLAAKDDAAVGEKEIEATTTPASPGGEPGKTPRLPLKEVVGVLVSEQLASYVRRQRSRDIF
jgi:hypothetical protein